MESQGTDTGERDDCDDASSPVNNSIGRKSPEGGVYQRSDVRVCFEHALKNHSAPCAVYVRVLLYNRENRSTRFVLII